MQDAVKPNSPNWHLPIPQFKDNLRRLVTRLQEQGVKKVVLITPPAVGKRSDRDTALTKTYAEAVQELAKELQLDCVDVFEPIVAVDKWQVSCPQACAVTNAVLGQNAQLVKHGTAICSESLPAAGHG